MTELTRPKPNRFKYSAMLLGVMAVAAAPIASPAIATAQRVWDIEDYDKCYEGIDVTQTPDDLYWKEMKDCCLRSGGVWKDTSPPAGRGECSAPPGDSKGSRQLPGNLQIPVDITTAPVTKEPPRPIQVPSDIATVSVLN
ncbi:MAG TPA: hypothetical protein VHT50_15775 [Mycobacterium sp.]|jgi:hypothetical protein|nr:hypothetical protein [Mycobacterium sp.]